MGLAGSLLLHGLTLLLVNAATSRPRLDFEFELPAEVEFGLTEAMEAAGGAGAQAAASVRGASGEGSVAAGGGSLDAGTDAGLDAGTDAGLDAADLVATASGAAEDEDETGELGNITEDTPTEPEALTGPARIPPGAQIALRIDMGEVRRSPLAPEVRRLLTAIPDWALILDGSGIDPLEDLDRLLIASPNLQRSRLIIAGRHTHADGTGDGRDYIHDVVQRFGATRGVPTPWSRRHGVDVAPWPNEDSTRRVLAIVGPRHFTITRPQDLLPTLSVARAREERAHEEPDTELEDAQGPDALLSMGPGDAFTVEIEGARRFVRSGQTARIPARLRLAVRSTDGTTIHIRGVATFDSPAQARDAFEFWNRERERTARNTMVRLMGLASALGDDLLELDGSTIRLHGPLTESQTRLLLGYLEGMVRQPRRRSSPPPRPTETPRGESRPGDPTQRASRATP